MFLGAVCVTDHSRNVHAWILLPDEVNVTDGEILADDVPPVVTLGVVPAQPVVEEVIEERCTGLFSKAVSFQDAIRLGFL